MEQGYLSDEIYNLVYSKVPRICVDLLISNSEGILLTRRAISPEKGKWHLPGGRILFRESINESIERIAKRELNLNVNIKELLGFMEFKEEDGGTKHSISLVFLCEIKSGEVKLNHESDDFIFSRQIPENTLIEHGRFLRDYLTLNN
jgi:ADP-ribose pyrophosphatase YjhB (NUDIX family)